MDQVDVFLLFHVIPWWHRHNAMVSDAIIAGLIAMVVVSTVMTIFASANLAGQEDASSWAVLWRVLQLQSDIVHIPHEEQTRREQSHQGGREVAARLEQSLAEDPNAPATATFDAREEIILYDNHYYYDQEDGEEALRQAVFDAQTEDDRKSMFDKIEEARQNQPWKEHVGSVAELVPGVLLSYNRSDAFAKDGFSHGDMVLLTLHESVQTLGYVMNRALPPEEADRARSMLREAGVDHENVARSSVLADAIKNSTRLWLGKGGPVVGEDQGWTHIHSCPGKHNAETLGGARARTKVSNWLKRGCT